MIRTIVQGSGMKRVAALADLHCPRTGEDVLRPLFTHIAGHFDPVVDRGLPSVAPQFQLGLWS